MKKNIFLNNKYLIKWTESNTAFLVQSPFNANAGIWWSSKWYQPSKNWPDKYFATGIVFEQDYQEIIYCDQGIKSTRNIKGRDLYQQFQKVISTNKNKYLAMALATALKLNNLSEEQIVPKKYQPQNAINQDLSW